VVAFPAEHGSTVHVGIDGNVLSMGVVTVLSPDKSTNTSSKSFYIAKDNVRKLYEYG
jgi:hypothetical protein